MKILDFNRGIFRNLTTGFMVLVTAYQTATNMMAFATLTLFGAVADSGAITVHKSILGLVVLIVLATSWSCLVGFNRAERRSLSVGFLLLWTLLAAVVGHSPFTGKGYGAFLYESRRQ